jgi:uncharacterized protein YecT (DUF1311 family)
MIRSVILLALIPAAPAVAQTQARMNQTAAAQHAAADVAMTRRWRSVYARMKQRDAQDRSRGGGFGYAAAALASQRAWLQFRDRQCVAESGEFAGGSLQAMTQAQCLARLTRERTVQLANLLWDH